jgi:hypothetical protein
MSALGTGDLDFKNGVVEQLANAQPPGSEESGLNFSISVVKGIEARDQIEAMLASQMAVIQAAIMRTARRVALANNILELESAEASLNKLVRTFTTLTDALKRHRSVGEPNITFQNVSVRDVGQAIAGNVIQYSTEIQPAKASQQAITDARVAPMEIVGERLEGPLPAKPKSNP